MLPNENCDHKTQRIKTTFICALNEKAYSSKAYSSKDVGLHVFSLLLAQT